MANIPDKVRRQVFAQKGKRCVVCGRTQGERRNNLPIHHIDANTNNNNLDNLIPVCQSCHVHIHREDKPPYRFYHRQLPKAARSSWNQYEANHYDGPAISLEEAIEQFSNEIGEPSSAKYQSFNQSKYPLYYHRYAPDGEIKPRPKQTKLSTFH
ncbi:HNH endonuclease [Halorubrum sp. CGM5_25_10-8B]|uniref:HNH endonuclease n=1 Tax=Halorubrum sp. CGM5_25_10-8B TaxID=2518115 RepID=UPI0010F504B9|nr:HNH endonuclease [Halorubrum sp. CGM5_25_10-8B]